MADLQNTIVREADALAKVLRVLEKAATDSGSKRIIAQGHLSAHVKQLERLRKKPAVSSDAKGTLMAGLDLAAQIAGHLRETASSSAAVVEETQTPARPGGPVGLFGRSHKKANTDTSVLATRLLEEVEGHRRAIDRLD